MSPADILDASRLCQIHKGHAPTLIGLHPSDYEGFSYGQDGDVFVCGIRIIECIDTEPGEIEVLLPKGP